MTMLDRVTEDISHFIGFFHLSVEEARLRDSFTDFYYHANIRDAVEQLTFSASFNAPYTLLGYDPALIYRPVPPDFPVAQPINTINEAQLVPAGFAWEIGESDARLPNGSGHVTVASGSISMMAPELEPPGSIATYAYQYIHLSDNDVFSVGGHGLSFQASVMSINEMLDLASTVTAFNPLAEVSAPGSAGDMISLIKTTADILNAAPNGIAGEMVVAQGETVSGIYVNGIQVDEAPKLEDFHSFEDDLDQAQVTWSGETGMPETSVEISMGGNTLLNDAVLKNLWTAAKVTAVLGDHIEINAVVQINAIWDEDGIDSGIADWSAENATGVNELYNIASFETDGNEGPPTATTDNSDLYPDFWSVTEITGDLMIVNWIEQLTLMSDSDVGIVSASGAYSAIVSGDNMAVNSSSFYELGFGYDLIIIGGSVYDANIIQQLTILFDNDVADATPGFETNGTGSVSSSDNLLWNQASIYTIGTDDRFSALSSDFVDAATSIEDGAPVLSDSILSNPEFLGLAGLRVLYVHGDLINLQYVKQTNILGDNDQIMLAMDALAPQAQASWSVDTGGNTLVNNASILDLDSFGKTYVGGQQYSQETLIQANFISSKPELNAQDPNALVSEAVLFLDDSMLGQDLGPAGGIDISTDHTVGQDDGLQSLLT